MHVLRVRESVRVSFNVLLSFFGERMVKKTRALKVRWLVLLLETPNFLGDGVLARTPSGDQFSPKLLCSKSLPVRDGNQKKKKA